MLNQSLDPWWHPEYIWLSVLYRCVIIKHIRVYMGSSQHLIVTKSPSTQTHLSRSRVSVYCWSGLIEFSFLWHLTRLQPCLSAPWPEPTALKQTKQQQKVKKDRPVGHNFGFTLLLWHQSKLSDGETNLIEDFLQVFWSWKTTTAIEMLNGTFISHK